MPFVVRSATPADASTIIEYNRLLALETENQVLDARVLAPGVAAILGDRNRGRYFVADDNGDVIGQIMITYEWSDWRNGWIWWLQSVYVRADRRKGGVFRSIFQHIEGQARKEGNVAGIRLYVEHENRAAQSTYRKLGFDEIHFFLLQKLLA
jgi:GNAT superfamily N-acetyltransferase